MIWHRLAVDSVAYTVPRKPFLYSRGRYPEWSIWACVSSTQLSSAGFTGSGIFSNRFSPCSIPQSTRKALFPTSSREQLPVTSCVAPINVTFMAFASPFSAALPAAFASVRMRTKDVFFSLYHSLCRRVPYFPQNLQDVQKAPEGIILRGLSLWICLRFAFRAYA